MFKLPIGKTMATGLCNRIKQQLKGRALILVDSLEIGRQTSSEAIKLLKEAFDSPIVKKFSTISQLNALQLDIDSDPYEYFSKMTN